MGASCRTILRIKEKKFQEKKFFSSLRFFWIYCAYVLKLRCELRDVVLNARLGNRGPPRGARRMRH